MAFIILYPYTPETPIYCSMSTDLTVAKNIFVEPEKRFVVAFAI